MILQLSECLVAIILCLSFAVLRSFRGDEKAITIQIKGIGVIIVIGFP